MFFFQMYWGSFVFCVYNHTFIMFIQIIHFTMVNKRRVMVASQTILKVLCNWHGAKCECQR